VTALEGIYFDGKTARGVSVQVSFTQEEIFLRGDAIEIREPIINIQLSPRLGRTRRQLRFADGAVCEIDDNPLLDNWFATHSQHRWNLLARLEAHWFAVTLSAILILTLVVAMALWGLPWAAQKIAMKMPQEWVDKLGSGTLSALDHVLGAESHLSPERQQTLRDKFSAIARTAKVPAKFEFRTWPQLGANALALPDSAIVVTDELVALADDDRELLAVVAHELGHEHERHSLQQLLTNSGVTGLVFVMTGDVSGLSNIVVLAPTIFTHLHHSRTLERNADRFGFALLQQSGIDPAWFARIIRKLAEAHRKKESNADSKSIHSSWLSTHPDSEARASEAEHYLNDMNN
jgi:Zn-dependent protease with chaperone function